MGAVQSLPRVERCAFGREWTLIDGPSVLQVTQGEVIVRSGEELVRAVAQDLVSVAPGERCRVRAARGMAHAERVAVDAELAQRALELCGAERVTACGEEGATVERRGSDRARRGARLLRELAGADSPETAAGRLRRMARCVELLAMTAEPRPAEPLPYTGSRGRGRSERFLRAVEELRSLPLDEITLPGFARRAGLSQRHVSRLFQLELGETFREHVAGLRLERAKALLRGTGMSVIEVAGETGWSSLAHFNAVFRRRVGATPSCFRLGGDAPARTRAPLRPGSDRVVAR